jgi:hypothetical protein
MRTYKDIKCDKKDKNNNLLLSFMKNICILPSDKILILDGPELRTSVFLVEKMDIKNHQIVIIEHNNDIYTQQKTKMTNDNVEHYFIHLYGSLSEHLDKLINENKYQFKCCYFDFMSNLTSKDNDDLDQFIHILDQKLDKVTIAFTFSVKGNRGDIHKQLFMKNGSYKNIYNSCISIISKWREYKIEKFYYHTYKRENGMPMYFSIGNYKYNEQTMSEIVTFDNITYFSNDTKHTLGLKIFDW